MKNRKGVEMGINTIVLIVIVLMVAAILIFLVGKKIGIFGSSTSCEGVGGECLSAPCSAGYHPLLVGGCNEGQICCQSDTAIENN